MSKNPANEIVPYNTHYFPLHLAFLTVGDNMMPIAHWMVISKEPFRFLIAMQLGNYSLKLLRKFQEAALHFMPWQDRERVVRAGYMSGDFSNKAEKLGFSLISAEKLSHTKLIEGFDVVFETRVWKEIPDISHEFAPFVLDVVAVQTRIEPIKRSPILFLKEKEFATIGDGWRFRR